MANVEEITVEELAKACSKEIKAGNGKKKILISSDDEGNEFHPLYYLFTQTKEEENPQDFFDTACVNKPSGVTDENVKDYIILG